MIFKVAMAASLSFVFVFTTLCFSNEKVHLKPPPKLKPQPEEITLPAPFDQWNECDLLSKLYSAYDCDTGIIGKKTNDESELEDVIADINQVSLWQSNGTKQLLVLIEIHFAKSHDNASGGKSADVGAFEIDNHKLNTAAFAETITSYRKYGFSKLDRASYNLNSTEAAIGIRWSPGINGIGEEYLDLYRLKDGKFHRIFRRKMWLENDSTESKSILQVIKSSSGINDFLVTTTIYSIDEHGKKKDEGSQRTKESWHWNQQGQTYE